jgi:glycosyltransferase involved in cell wall biosynthesis
MTMLRALMTADAVGGVWTYALELARALASSDVRTTLVTMGPPPDADQLAAARSIHRLDVICTSFALEWMADAWRDAEATADWLLALEQRLRPSIIHLNAFSFGALPWRAPAVVVGHSCVLSWAEAVGGEIEREWLERYRAAVTRGLRGARWVVAPSATMLATLQRLYGPLPFASVVHNGRDPDRFQPREKQRLIVSGGRLWDRAKNVDALEAIETRLSWPLLVAGDATIGHGRSPERDMIALLGRASIVALPARYEPFGLLPLEAALAGCALVLGDIPSLREIWGDAAVYVNPDDPEALLAAIEELIAEPERLRCTAARARQRALFFTPAAMAHGYLAVYRSVIGSGDIDPWRLACAS